MNRFYKLDKYDIICNMKNLKTKYRRILIKTLNKLIKSSKITKNINLFLLFYLICFMLIHLADFYIWEMQVARIFLVGLIITFIWALFYKQKNKNRISRSVRSSIVGAIICSNNIYPFSPLHLWHNNFT